MVFILSESPLGYALIKINQELNSIKAIKSFFNKPESAKQALKVVDFKKFTDISEAMRACSLGESKDDLLLKPLKKLIKHNILKNNAKDTLFLESSKMGLLISKKFNVNCQADEISLELIRNIRQYLYQHVTGLNSKESIIMHRGLAHHFSRFKLQFSPEKEDYMIIQAIKLLEDLDKCLNQLSMRLREWFGTNFPELAKIINDNLLFAKIIVRAKTRMGIVSSDFSDFLQKDVEDEIKASAKYSMGTKLEKEDVHKICNLAILVIDYNEDRSRLLTYLTNRMQTIAPNLTAVVGERVGAKLIAHASSLVNLAKCPASTLQIMGAEKALFRALKKHTSTPKFGHIYHTSLIGSTVLNIRGKIARTLACKASLAVRIDAFDNYNNDPKIGIKMKRHIERRINVLTQNKNSKIKNNLFEPIPNSSKRAMSSYQPETDIIKHELKQKDVKLKTRTKIISQKKIYDVMQ